MSRSWPFSKRVSYRDDNNSRLPEPRGRSPARPCSPLQDVFRRELVQNLELTRDYSGVAAPVPLPNYRIPRISAPGFRRELRKTSTVRRTTEVVDTVL